MTLKSPQTRKTVFYKDTDLASRFGVHRITIWRWTRQNKFPKPVKLSPACSRWKAEDVDTWESARETAAH